MHEGEMLGGSSLSLYNLLRSLPEDCHPIVVVQQRGMVYDYFASRHIEVWDVASQVNYCGDGYKLKYYTTWVIRYLRDALQRARFISNIEKKLAGRKIDIVHSNSAAIDVGNALAKRLNARHVWHLREFVGPATPFKPFMPFAYLKAQLRRADSTICISHSIAKHYDVDGWDRNHTIYDAVGKKEDVCEYGERDKYFLFCGGEIKVKRPEIAIRAFCIFHRQHPDYKLHILGHQDETYHKELLNLIPEESRRAVIFDGFTNQVDQFLRKATGLLMCTEFEALGRVTIEAQLKSCPVIGFASGGTLELIEDNKTGKLFHSIEECAQCMHQLVEHPEEAEKLASSSLRFAQANFLEEAYGQRINSLYSKLITTK